MKKKIMNVKLLEYYERQKTQLHTKLHVQRSLILILHKNRKLGGQSFLLYVI